MTRWPAPFRVLVQSVLTQFTAWLEAKPCTSTTAFSPPETGGRSMKAMRTPAEEKNCMGVQHEPADLARAMRAGKFGKRVTGGDRGAEVSDEVSPQRADAMGEPRAPLKGGAPRRQVKKVLDF